MQFLFSSFAPFNKPFETETKYSLNELYNNSLKKINNLASYDLSKGKYLAC